MTSFLQRRIPESLLGEAAWVARCIGRDELAPLDESDVVSLASYLSSRPLERGEVLLAAGEAPEGVCIVRSGTIELAVGSGRRRAVVQLLRPGDIEGDIQLVLGMPLPYAARAIEESRCLMIEAASFERLIAERPAVARRWLWSVAARLARSQMRIFQLLPRSLPERAARLLLDEAVAGQISFPQRTLAAMLGARRPSLNKVLKDLERQGLVQLGFSKIEIIDRDGLEHLGAWTGAGLAETGGPRTGSRGDDTRGK